MVVLLRKRYHADGDGQYQDFIQRLQHYLRNHQRGHFLPGNHTTQSQWEEDDGVGSLAKDGAQYRTCRKGFIIILCIGILSRRQLHLRHHIGIDKRTCDEGDKRGCSDTGSQSEDDVETLVTMPIWCSWNPVGNSAHDDEEEVHGEPHPYQHARTGITPHLAHHVVDDVTNGKDDNTCSQINRSE